jgi:fido (protein-threonine AMPylation protein)
MTDLHAADDHATPLTPAEREDLIPTHITLRSELNELEQKNIATAIRWAFGRRKVVTRESFLKSLHRRMFNQVWRWAGKHRPPTETWGSNLISSKSNFEKLSMTPAIGSNTKHIRMMKSLPAFIIGWFSCTLFRTATAAGPDWRQTS